MAFVNRLISSEDRAKFNLDASDRWVPFPSPSPDWAIDEENQSFLRLLRPFARRSEFGDPDSLLEDDFHFHWMGRDFIVCTRGGITPEDYEGRQFGSMPSIVGEKKIYTFLVREIAEVCSPGWNWKFAQECTDQNFFDDLRFAFAQANAGAFTSIYGKPYHGPRDAILKIALGVRS